MILGVIEATSMKILFVGINIFSYHCLNEVIKNGGNVAAIITKKYSVFNADFKDLTPLARKYNVPIYYIKDINSDKSFKIVKKYNPDMIFCLGWSQLIKKKILNFPKLGVVGVHPAKLPQNRGRHPLIWALALGLEKSALTFFKMDEGADTGDIVSQKEFKISRKDDAASLYEKVKKLASMQIRGFMPKLNSGEIKYRKQDIGRGNIWRKRGETDGAIDWRMSSRAIYNLVRALTRPYMGAHCFYNGIQVRIWKVGEVVSRKKNIEPGKVLGISGKGITVKTYDGAIKILKHNFPSPPKKGEYLK